MSVSFRLEGLEAFEKSLLRFLDVVEHDVSEHVKDLAYRITYNLVMETPQYSGAAASAWRVGIGAPVYVSWKPEWDVPGRGAVVGDNPFSKRDRNMAAVNDALKLCGFEIGMYSLKAGDLWIANGLDYPHWFEQGQHAPGKALRTENLPHRTVNAVVQDSLNPASVLRF